MALLDILSLLLNHQTEAEKAALAQKDYNAAAAAPYSDPVTQAKIAQAAAYGTYGRDNPNGNVDLAQAGVVSPTERAGMDTTLAREASGFYPTTAKADTSLSRASGAQSDIALADALHRQTLQPIINQTADATANSGLAQAKIGQNENEYTFNKILPVSNAARYQGAVNTLGSEQLVPQAGTGFSDKYTVDANGNLVRTRVSTLLPFKEQFMRNALGGSGAGGKPVSVGGGLNIMGSDSQVMDTIPELARPTSSPTPVLDDLYSSLMRGGSDGGKVERQPVTSSLGASTMTAPERESSAYESKNNVSYPAVSRESLKKQPLPTPSGRGVIYVDDNNQIQYKPTFMQRLAANPNWPHHNPNTDISPEDEAWLKHVESQIK